MKTATLLLSVLCLAASALVGCAKEKTTAGEPPILGLGPGETAPYEEATPGTPGSAVPVTGINTPTASGTVGANSTAPTTSRSTGAAANTNTATTAASATAPRMYTVKKGDTLSSIAKKFYGSANYKKIYEANRDKIKDPNHLLAGIEIRIP